MGIERTEHDLPKRPRRLKKRLGMDANAFLANITQREINAELTSDLSVARRSILDWLDPEVVRQCVKEMKALKIEPKITPEKQPPPS